MPKHLSTPCDGLPLEIVATKEGDRVRRLSLDYHLQRKALVTSLEMLVDNPSNHEDYRNDNDKRNSCAYSHDSHYYSFGNSLASVASIEDASNCLSGISSTS